MSRKSVDLFLHTPVGVPLPMNTKREGALFPILNTVLSWKRNSNCTRFIDRWKQKAAPGYLWPPRGIQCAGLSTTTRTHGILSKKSPIDAFRRWRQRTACRRTNSADRTGGAIKQSEETGYFWKDPRTFSSMFEVGRQSNALEKRPLLPLSPSESGCGPSPICCNV